MGALVRDEPLNVWSRIQLVVWDGPEEVQLWQLGQLFIDCLEYRRDYLMHNLATTEL